jgi:hypothetical protein
MTWNVPVVAALTNMARTRPTKKTAPVIPEPSPRFIVWSAVVAVLLAAAILTYDYNRGFGGTAAAEPASAATLSHHPKG